MSGPLENFEPYQPALNEALARHGVVLAYLYGSQARGDAGPLSDVDIAVKFESGLSRRERFDHVLLRNGPGFGERRRFARGAGFVTEGVRRPRAAG